MLSVPRILGFLAAVVAVAAWFVRTAVRSDFNEPGLLVLGLVSFAFLFVLKGRAKFVWIKIAALAALALLAAAVGLGLGAYGRHEARFNDAQARQVLVEVGRSLDRYIEMKDDAPDCPFPCMAEALQDAGAFRGLEIPYEDGRPSLHIEKIPSKDGWICRFYYRKLSQTSYILRSSGADRRFDTADDITIPSALLAVQPAGKLPVWNGFLPGK